MTTTELSTYPVRGEQLSQWATKRLRQPSDPAEIARRRMEALTADARRRELADRLAREPENWGLDERVGQLVGELANVGRDLAGRPTRAARWDTFRLLRTAGTLTGDHIIVLDKLHRLMAVRAHTAGASDIRTPVDGLTPKDYPRAQVEAGVRVDGLMAHMDAQERQERLARGNALPPYRSRLLLALSGPTIIEGRPVNNWRKVVEQITGEYRDKQQSGEVAKACDALELAVTEGADQKAWERFLEEQAKRAA